MVLCRALCSSGCFGCRSVWGDTAACNVQVVALGGWAGDTRAGLLACMSDLMAPFKCLGEGYALA